LRSEPSISVVPLSQSIHMRRKVYATRDSSHDHLNSQDTKIYA